MRSEPSGSVDPISVVRRLVEAINRGDWAALWELLHPAFRRHSTAAGSTGAEDATAFVRFLQKERRA